MLFNVLHEVYRILHGTVRKINHPQRKLNRLFKSEILTKKITFDGRKYNVVTNMATVQEQSDLKELNKQVSALREMVSQRRQRKTMKEQGIFRFTGLISSNKELPHPLRQHIQIQGCIRTNI